MELYKLLVLFISRLFGSSGVHASAMAASWALLAGATE